MLFKAKAGREGEAGEEVEVEVEEELVLEVVCAPLLLFITSADCSDDERNKGEA